jgi:hypothetical protein
MSVQELLVSMLKHGEIVFIPQYACEVTLIFTEAHFMRKARVHWTTYKGMSIIHISPVDNNNGDGVTASLPLGEGTHSVMVVRGALRYLDRTD